jgi:large subunit ribosomal protein L25
VPANIFGQSASTAIQVPVKDVEQTIRRAGHNQLVSLGVKGGETTTVLITKWQRHPYKADLLHVDFFRVAMTERMQLAVPLRLVGEAPAVKITGGQPFQTLAAVNVECLPTDIPEAIEVDISGLAENDASIFVRDLTPPEGVLFVTDGDEQVVKIMAPRVAQAGDGGDDEPAAVASADESAESSEDSDS